MMTAIDYLPISEFASLASAWHRLESGSEMTYFQTYDWYMSLLPAIPKDTRNHEARFIVLKEDGIVKIIAPIWVVKRNYLKVNESGVFILGRSGWSDYLNFIYTEAKIDDIIFIINDIVRHYGINTFYFEEIPEGCLLYRAITECFQVKYCHQTTCIGIQLPNDVAQYDMVLSKHTRQNIRTAGNRLNTDSKIIHYVFDDTAVDTNKCSDIRHIRLSKKNERKSTILSIKVRLCNLLRPRFRYDIPFYVDRNSHIMSAYINGELAAYFNYGIDRIHGIIVIMAAGISENYSWYSPGLLLAYNFILHQIREQKIKIVDFTRGDERYKYSLGGVEHFNSTFEFIV